MLSVRRDDSSPPIWSIGADEVCQRLGTSEEGLSEEEARLRLSRHGFNELARPPGRSLLLRFLDQLIHLMAILLWVAGGLAFLSGTPQLGWAIWAVILINALFSFWQEYKAERALSELKKMLPTQAKVYRQGLLKVILARELVPGDIVHLEEGDSISADARLISADMLLVDLSPLTGESVPVARHPEEVSLSCTHPADASNLVLAGTTVTAGEGLAVVYATGTATEFGKVAHLTATVVREPSTLEKQVAGIVRVTSFLAVSTGVAIFLLGLLLVGVEIKESFIFAIGMTVALVPEGLLPTVTLSLAMGVQRMARRNALVRRLSAVETLSATTVICSDKTGTITKNEMTVRRAWVPSATAEVTGTGYDPGGEIRMRGSGEEERRIRLLIAGAALCSNARLIHSASSSSWQVIGDPTEGALLVAAGKTHLDPARLHLKAHRIREIPFDPHRRMMTVVVHWDLHELWPAANPFLAFTKGAPLELLQRCRLVLKDGRIQDLSDPDRAEISGANDALAGEGYRLLAVAFREGGGELKDLPPQKVEEDLIFIGLVAMLDPPRPRVKGAIALCRQAGIIVTMVTGDYGLTAEAIARRIGLITGEARILTGREMENLSEEELRRLLTEKSGLIFARVMPEQKLRLVKAYQALGHVVAVTGDGVNDAPALRAANIGIAMGKSGTDVAREAADIVLADDNFATIIDAVEQARAIYLNIRKFMTYILSSNMPEVVPFIAMLAFKIPPALNIMQILAVDLGTDMVPAVALGADPPEQGVMEQPPRSKEKPLLDLTLLARSYLFLGLIEAVVGMMAFFWIWGAHGFSWGDLLRAAAALLTHSADARVTGIYQLATTAMLASIVTAQLGNVFACRSESTSIIRIGFFSNRLIWIGIAAEWVIILCVVYLHPLQKIFGTASLSLEIFLLLLLWPLLLLGLEEVRKIVVRSGRMTAVMR